MLGEVSNGEVRKNGGFDPERWAHPSRRDSASFRRQLGAAASRWLLI